MAINNIRKISLDVLRSAASVIDAGRWDEIIIHHFASPSAAQYNGLATWNSVYRYHTSNRGWSDIGYHVGVGPDGSIWLLRHSDGGGYKGALRASGAHCVGHNSRGLGVVLAGDFDREDPRKNGWRTLVEVVALLAQRFSIPANKIYPHSAFAAKSCPGKLFDFSAFRREVAAVIGGEVGPVPEGPALPGMAVVVGSSYVTTDVIFKDGRGYAPIADLYRSAGWTVEFRKTANGLRWYPKSPEWR